MWSCSLWLLATCLFYQTLIVVAFFGRSSNPAAQAAVNNIEKPRVAVAGATGYIGRVVVQELVRRGYPTAALVRDASTISSQTSKCIQGAELIECNVCDESSVANAYAAFKPSSTICCLASRSGTKRESFEVDYGGGTVYVCHVVMYVIYVVYVVCNMSHHTTIPHRLSTSPFLLLLLPPKSKSSLPSSPLITSIIIHLIIITLTPLIIIITLNHHDMYTHITGKKVFLAQEKVALDYYNEQINNGGKDTSQPSLSHHYVLLRYTIYPIYPIYTIYPILYTI